MKVDILKEIGVDLSSFEGDDLDVFSPIDGAKVASLRYDPENMYDDKVMQAGKAFAKWREVPVPKRGELIRLFAEELRKVKGLLGKLVTVECGKIFEEGRSLPFAWGPILDTSFFGRESILKEPALFRYPLQGIFPGERALPSLFSALLQAALEAHRLHKLLLLG